MTENRLFVRLERAVRAVTKISGAARLGGCLFRRVVKISSRERARASQSICHPIGRHGYTAA